jgi:uncharacterized integral membrane protein (TIGR00698 family)
VTRWASSSLRSVSPGIVLAAIGAGLAFAINQRLPSVSPLTAGVVIGAVAGNLGLVPSRARPGLTFSARTFLRVGVVLLGLQLAIGDVAQLGGRGMLAVLAAVTVTFFGCRLLARRMGLSEGMGLLVATGYSICGVSAVSAMKDVAGADDDDAAYAIGLVTLCGSLSIVVLPLLGHLFNLSDGLFGAWTGAAVHDVAQVVATASAWQSDVALQSAVVVKLTRVVLLAPLVAIVALSRRRAAAQSGQGTDSGKRPPLVPPFVAGFLIAVAVASTGWLSSDVEQTAKTIERVLLTTALVGLGAGVDVRRMARLGGRPLSFGLASWLLVMVMSLAAVAAAGIGR